MTGKGSLYVHLFTMVVFFFLTMYLRPPEKTEQQKSLHLAPPAQQIKNFTFGYSDILADLFWLRVLQKFDYCENEDSPRALNQGLDIEAILDYEMPPSRCHKGWVFQMIDRITDLSPSFRYAYAAGASLLSIAVDDREGARIIFEKAMRKFPKDWSIIYRAAYHYLFEIQNGSRAAILMEAAAKNGAPGWVISLSSRIHTKMGKVELGITVLQDFLKKNPDTSFKEYILRRISVLEKEASEPSQRKPADGK